eukprot:gene9404-1650_t
MDGTTTVSTSIDAVLALPQPGAIDKTTLSKLEPDQQATAIAQLAEKSVQIAEMLSNCVNELGSANAELTFNLIGVEKQSFPHPNWPRLIKAVQTNPTQPLEVQYEDFGLWRAVQKATERTIQTAERCLRPSLGDSDSTLENNALQQDSSSSMRSDLVKTYGEEIDQLRQDRRFQDQHISLLIDSLDMATELFSNDQTGL